MTNYPAPLASEHYDFRPTSNLLSGSAGDPARSDSTSACIWAQYGAAARCPECALGDWPCRQKGVDQIQRRTVGRQGGQGRPLAYRAKLQEWEVFARSGDTFVD